MNSDIIKARYALIGTSLFVVALIIGSYIWQTRRMKEHFVGMAKNQVHSQMHQDHLYRQWASMHGGIYVPVTADTPPNQYLKVQDREIYGPDSVVLTLMNPAYITRQVNELGVRLDLTHGHITSLNPIRPENKPDEWEFAALASFERNGVKAAFGRDTINGREFFRYMEPFVTEKSCLKCHRQQGYQEGDIRGGISVSIPAEGFDTLTETNTATIAKVHICVFLLVMVVILAFYSPLVKKIKENTKYKQKLVEQAGELKRQNEEYASLNADLNASTAEYKKLAEMYKKQNVLLNKAKEKAEESDRLKTSFLNNMSHEIRTPMNGIIGFSQMIQNKNLDEAKRSFYITVIQDSCQQLLNIVSDILEIAKIETGQIELNLNPVSVRNIILLAKEKWETKAAARENKIIIDNRIPEAKDLIVADEQLLFRIVTHLLSNAIKFTEQGIITIAAKVKNGELAISVSDTGIGIDKDLHGIIFERFRKAEIGSSYTFGGTGLGLSICKGYADFLGGQLSVQSVVGEGSEFVYVQKYSEAKFDGSLIDDDDYIPEQGHSTSILIVDDDKMNYLYLKELLQASYQLAYASNGKEAVDMVQRADYDIVLMDLKMPEMNGFDATKAIVDSGKNTIVIAQTAFDSDHERKLAIDAGCINVISKPIDSDKLHRMLNSYIATSNAARNA